MRTPAGDRASDLLDALVILAKHRNDEPSTYRVVHAAATAAISELHDDLLDPRGGDFDAAVQRHAALARRLRDLPRPMAGQVGGETPRRPSAGPATDPFSTLLGRIRRTGPSVDSLLAEMASGVLPQVERAVREGLGDLFAAMDRPDAADDDDWFDPGDEGTDGPE